MTDQALNGALELVKRYGWYVFRVNVGHNTKQCDGGKSNCKTVDFLGQSWPKVSSNDPDVIQGWDWSGTNAYGIDLNRSCLAAVDVDPGGLYEDAATRVHGSGRGRHYIYEDLLGGIPNRTPDGWNHIDIKAAGGLVLGPGSHHPHGDYSVLRDVDPTPVPMSLREACVKRITREDHEAEDVQPLGAQEAIDRIEGAFRKMADTPDGLRNNTLHDMALGVAGLWVRLAPGDQKGVLAEDHLKAKLLAAVPNDGDPVKSKGTIDRGWAWGLEHPIRDEKPALVANAGSRMISGWSFVNDLGAPTVPLWGRGDQVLWAEGEALIIAGGQGAGKTTLGQQVMLGRLGALEFAEVLGLPVTPGTRKTLYLAMDRPRQAARSLERMVRSAGISETLLNERLVAWPGPPEADLAQQEHLLLEMCQEANADTVVVDSLKDAAVGLSDDAVGSAYNRARQRVIVEGIQVLELHHNRKVPTSSSRNGAPPGIDNIYGSTWITSGSGSVLLLVGAPGDLVVRMHHVKQPLDVVGPWQLIHDHDIGRTEIFHQADLVEIAKSVKGNKGITAVEAAAVLSDVAEDKVTNNDKKKAQRRLDKLVRAGLLKVVQQGDAGSKTPTRWGYVE